MSTSPLTFSELVFRNTAHFFLHGHKNRLIKKKSNGGKTNENEFKKNRNYHVV